MNLTHSPTAWRLCALFATACVTASAWAQSPSPAAAVAQRFPDVIAVQVRSAGDNRFNFDVTVSSPYDTPQRYADGFRVRTPAGAVLGERKLWHDHQGEQPFTRDLYGVKIGPGVRQVRVQARDQAHGYGGAEMEVVLPGR